MLFAAITFTNALGYIGTLLLGAIAGVLLDNVLSPRLNVRRARRSAERARQHHRSYDYAGRPFEFDGVDVGLQVLFGTLGSVTLLLAGDGPVTFRDRFTGRVHTPSQREVRAFVEITAANELDALTHNHALLAKHGADLLTLFTGVQDDLSETAWRPCVDLLGGRGGHVVEVDGARIAGQES